MASKIDPGQAKSLIQEFRTQNKASTDPLKTPDGQNLNGFFLDRESLDSILKDPKVAGIHVNFAMPSRCPGGCSEETWPLNFRLWFCFGEFRR